MIMMTGCAGWWRQIGAFHYFHAFRRHQNTGATSESRRRGVRLSAWLHPADLVETALHGDATITILARCNVTPLPCRPSSRAGTCARGLQGVANACPSNKRLAMICELWTHADECRSHGCAIWPLGLAREGEGGILNDQAIGRPYGTGALVTAFDCAPEMPTNTCRGRGRGRMNHPDDGSHMDSTQTTVMALAHWENQN